MYQKTKPLFFRVETPMHVGSGSDLGHIDLPIQREKHTSFPNIQSSSLKGALREHLEQRVKEDDDKIGIQLTFGYDSDGVKKESAVASFFSDKEDKDYAGSLAFTDARLLLFPIKSYKGVYTLTTCPLILNKFYKELNYICNPKVAFADHSFDLTDKAAVANKDFLSVDGGGKVILEEYSFDIDNNSNDKANKLAEELAKLLGNDEIKNHLVVLPNEVFRDFTVLSTEVITRTKIQNDTGTVQSGALFTEEYLPAESYMYSLVAASRVFGKKKNGLESADNVIDFFNSKLGDVAQIGGSRTLGKGIVKFLKPKS